MNKELSGFVATIALAGCGTAPPPTPTQMRDPSRFSDAHIYCTPDNESHFESVTTELAKVDAAPPAQPFYATGSSATRAAFALFAAGWGAEDE